MDTITPVHCYTTHVGLFIFPLSCLKHDIAVITPLTPTDLYYFVLAFILLPALYNRSCTSCDAYS